MWYALYLAVNISVVGVLYSVYSFNMWQVLMVQVLMGICGLLGYYDAKDKYK